MEKVETGTGLTAKIEPFDSFWEAPENVEKGFDTFGKFYRSNYLKHLPKNRDANILGAMHLYRNETKPRSEKTSERGFCRRE